MGELPGRWHLRFMILLVDDNIEAIEAMARLIEKLGYVVVPAFSPREAIDKAADMADFDLLITGITLPDMDGFELYRQLRFIKPRLKSLFLSGFLEPETLPALGNNISVLQKPVAGDELKEIITSLLGY